MAVFTSTCHGAMQHENPSSTGKSGYLFFQSHDSCLALYAVRAARVGHQQVYSYVD